MAGAVQPKVRVLQSLREISRADWDAVANPGWPSDGPLTPRVDVDCDDRHKRVAALVRPAYNPFVSHDFLWSLEESGCATRETGWLGQHLVTDGNDGKPAAIMPCYAKSHSQGEYVFDHGWADAFARAGGRYYPKLQAAVPFTPVPGPRLLVRDGGDPARAVLAAAGLELTRRAGASSLHLTFLTEAEWQMLGAAGYLQRTDQQFHFVNDGYRDFNDFLVALSSRHRKAVKRERRDAVEGLQVVALTGRDLTESVWDAFFRFYMDTGGRKWGRPYLNRQFFSLVGQRMADRILMVLALRDNAPVAGALNFIGSDTLYGRYWGTTIEQPFLHFELCYYQAIEWGIDHGLARVEAGAQGEHKLARGYRPTTTYSAHYIADEGFRAAVADYLKRERREVTRDQEALAGFLPFKASD